MCLQFLFSNRTSSKYVNKNRDKLLAKSFLIRRMRWTQKHFSHSRYGSDVYQESYPRPKVRKTHDSGRACDSRGRKPPDHHEHRKREHKPIRAFGIQDCKGVGSGDYGGFRSRGKINSSIKIITKCMRVSTPRPGEAGSPT